MKIGQAVNHHHWLLLGRRIQIITTYFGSSTLTTHAKVPLVQPSHLQYFQRKAICAVQLFAHNLTSGIFADANSLLVFNTSRSHSLIAAEVESLKIFFLSLYDETS
ncbi:hypothetical protein IKN40_02680 [bacterium]|nr:hypothetical protein [bacterium]